MYCKKGVFAILASALAVSLIACSSGGSGATNETTNAEATTIETTIATQPPTVATSEETNEYDVLDTFIELYNSSVENPITDTVEMEIQGDDYRTEFRLTAFKNAVGLKGTIGESTVEVVNYGVWDNDSIRIYARVDSHDAAIEIVYNIIHILDSSVTDEQIADDVSTEHSILLGNRNQISGCISADYADGGIIGYDVMIDCSSVDFIK